MKKSSTPTSPKKYYKRKTEGWITINTDAGFFPFDKVGSYAYWIKGDNGLFLTGHGMLKTNPRSSTEAEAMAVANALHALMVSNQPRIRKIIFNCDNIHVKSKRKGTPAERKIYQLIRKIRQKSLLENAITHAETPTFYVFRHVKAHSGTATPRQYVNDWLDQKCTMHLRSWKEKKMQNT